MSASTGLGIFTDTKVIEAIHAGRGRLQAALEVLQGQSRYHHNLSAKHSVLADEADQEIVEVQKVLRALAFVGVTEVTPEMLLDD